MARFQPSLLSYINVVVLLISVFIVSSGLFQNEILILCNVFTAIKTSVWRPFVLYFVFHSIRVFWTRQAATISKKYFYKSSLDQKQMYNSVSIKFSDCVFLESDFPKL